MVARMLGEPLLHLRVRVGAVVVEDQMDLAPARRRVADALEELQELAVPVARQTAPDHGAVEDVERGEQRGSAVPLVGVRLPCRNAGSQRQYRLRPIQGLNLALLV